MSTNYKVTCSPQEAAALLGLHPATIRRMVRDGELLAITRHNRVKVSLFSLAQALGTQVEELRRFLEPIADRASGSVSASSPPMNGPALQTPARVATPPVPEATSTHRPADHETTASDSPPPAGPAATSRRRSAGGDAETSAGVRHYLAGVERAEQRGPDADED